MDYILSTIKTDKSEIIIAFLADLPYDTFEEKEEGVLAYIPQKDFSAEVQAQLKDLSEQFGFSYENEVIKAQNWNTKWESQFDPIVIDDYCAIRASFHEPIPTVKHEIIIDPKMAFGTGHHATTELCIRQISTLDLKDKLVFDFGCGTGILAIVAHLEGAKKAVAIDYDINSYDNTIENIEINKLDASNFEVLHGELKDVKPQPWDVILANINRHVILNSLHTLYLQLKEGGYIIFSGILKSDEKLLTDSLTDTGFKIQTINEKDGWLCILCQK